MSIEIKEVIEKEDGSCEIVADVDESFVQAAINFYLNHIIKEQLQKQNQTCRGCSGNCK